MLCPRPLNLFFALSLSTAPAFLWPPRYTIIGTWSIPYANVSNPILIVQEPNRQYTSQLNGLERVWTTTAEDHSNARS
jgi:hypothetical protein